MPSFFQGLVQGVAEGGSESIRETKKRKFEEDERKMKYLDTIKLYEKQSDLSTQRDLERISAQEESTKRLKQEETKQQKDLFDPLVEQYAETNPGLSKALQTRDPATISAIGQIEKLNIEQEQKNRIIEAINTSSMDVSGTQSSMKDNTKSVYEKVTGEQNPLVGLRGGLEGALKQNTTLALDKDMARAGAANIDLAKFQYEQEQARAKPLYKQSVDVVTAASEAMKIMDEVEDLIADDPSRFGAAKGLRDILSTAGEQGDALLSFVAGKGPEYLAEFKENLDKEAYDEISGPLTDPKGDAVDIMRNVLAYSIARSNNQGRLTNQMIKDARQQLKFSDVTGFLSSKRQLEKSMMDQANNAVKSARLEDRDIPEYFVSMWDKKTNPETKYEEETIEMSEDDLGEVTIDEDGRKIVIIEGMKYEVMD